MVLFFPPPNSCVISASSVDDALDCLWATFLSGKSAVLSSSFHYVDFLYSGMMLDFLESARSTVVLDDYFWAAPAAVEEVLSPPLLTLRSRL